MEGLIVKDVSFENNSIRAVQDETGNIYAGLVWICRGIGLSEDRMKYERKKIQNDIVLCDAVKFYPIGNSNGIHDVLCIQIDYIPLWLAKISITPRMQAETPEVVKSLVEYQLKVKDVLAREFMKKPQPQESELMLLNQKIDKLYDEIGKFAQLVMSWHSVTEPAPIVAKEPLVLVEKSPEDEWKEKIFSTIDEYLKHNNQYSCPRSVLRTVYIYMRRNYGVCWEQAAKEYKSGNELRAEKLSLIYANDTYRSIFECVLNDLIANTGIKEDKALQVVIEPLVEKRHDTSKNGCATYRLVYRRMNKVHRVDWKNQTTRCGKKKPTKKELVIGNTRLFKIFKQSVNEILKGV